MKKSLFASLALSCAALAASAQPVQINQNVCGTVKRAFELAEKDNMIVYGQGPSVRPENSGGMSYFLVAPDGFWVALTAANMTALDGQGNPKTDASGKPMRVSRACVMATGDNWEKLPMREAQLEIGAEPFQKKPKLRIPATNMFTQLERSLGEIPRAQMFAKNGDRVTLVVSNNGSWSVVQTEKASGLAFLSEWGMLFEQRELAAKVPSE